MMFKSFFIAVAAAYTAFVHTLFGGASAPQSSTLTQATSAVQVISSETASSTTQPSTHAAVVSNPGKSVTNSTSVSVPASHEATPSGNSALQGLQQQLSNLIQQQQKQYQPYEFTPEKVETPATSTVARKIYDATLNNNSILLHTNFAIDTHSVKLIAVDHPNFSASQTTTNTYALIPASEVTATTRTDGTYAYLIPFVTRLNEVFSSNSFWIPIFHITFQPALGPTLSSKDFVFGTSTFSYTAPPPLNTSSDASYLANLQF